MKEIWAVYNGDVFDRIILRGWWIYRQECCMDVDTGQVSWHDVPFFRKRLKKRVPVPEVNPADLRKMYSEKDILDAMDEWKILQGPKL